MAALEPRPTRLLVPVLQQVVSPGANHLPPLGSASFRLPVKL